MGPLGKFIEHCRIVAELPVIPYTLESGIDVGQGINVGPGKLGKKNKRRALNIHVLCSE